jgi:low affinity Fe/Cu permease
MAEQRSSAARTRATDEERSWFESFVEQAYQFVSRAPFFFVCLAIIGIWAVTLPWFTDLKSWQVVIHTVSSVLSLLLLVLLENSSRRAEEAAQEKLNVLAEALAALMRSRASDDPELEEAVQQLSDAVGLEARH